MKCRYYYHSGAKALQVLLLLLTAATTVWSLADGIGRTSTASEGVVDKRRQASLAARLLDVSYVPEEVLHHHVYQTPLPSPTAASSSDDAAISVVPQRSLDAAEEGDSASTASATVHRPTLDADVHFELVGYLIGVLKPTATMGDVARFVGHDDVHRIDHHHGSHRHVLVYAAPGATWLHCHFDERDHSTTTTTSDPLPEASEGGSASPFRRILRVPDPHTSYLSPLLWPPSSPPMPPTAAAASSTTVPVSHVLDVSVTVSEVARRLDNGGDVAAWLAQLLERDAAASGTCRGRLVGLTTTKQGSTTTPTRLSSRALRLRLEVTGTATTAAAATTSTPHLVETLLANRTWRYASTAYACRRILAAVATAPMVRWVEPKQTFHTQNHMATVTMQNPTLAGGGTRHTLWERGITGEGQLVAVGDTGLDFDSCFFADPAHEVAMYPRTNPQHRKILSYQQCEDEGLTPDHTDVPGGHGTHVSGSAAGNSLTQNQDYNGMAKDARIFFQDLTCGQGGGLLLPSDLEEYYTPAYDTGVRVSSNSWGGDHPESYVTTDRLSDKFLYEHQDYLVVVAAGNNPITGILSPSSSKNVLSVGAHMNSWSAATREELAQFSARGPSYDGRIKPDLTAPGNPVTSALSDGRTDSFQCTTTVRMGTSMATPHVAGAAVLLRQYLLEGYMPSGAQNNSHRVMTPSAALMKALLIQATVPMKGNAGTAPNGMQGHGRLELPLLMWFAPTAATTNPSPSSSSFRIIKDRLKVKHGEQASFCFSSSAASGNTDPVSFVRVTLAWIDAASAIEGSHRSLVNDLDVVVVAADGTMYYPGATDNTVSGSFDRLNNVEQITVSTPTLLGGRFRVVVYGYDVHDDARYDGQPFAITVWAPSLRELVGAACPVSTMGCPGGCSGIGSCIEGVCTCPATHHHVDCSQCNGTAVCGGNGVCTFAQACTCSATGHFASGTKCATCAEGWYGPHCDNDCACGGSSHGVCDGSGVCQCVRPWVSPSAGGAAAAASTPSPSPSSCYDGASCAYCCRDFGGPTCNSPSYWCVQRQTRIIDATRSTTPRTGLIQINGYGQYPNSLKCHWRIVAPGPGWRVRLYVSEFQVETPYDYARVFDGNETLADHELAQYSGTAGQGETLESTLQEMQVTFFSDYTSPDRGFTMVYEFIEPLATTAPAPTPQPSTTTTTTTTSTLSTTTTTAAPTSTATPPATPIITTSTTGAPRACATLQDCTADHSVRCEHGACVCLPMFTGARCEARCPVTRSGGTDGDGATLTACNGRGQCTGPMQCTDCAAGFTGNGCQFDLPNRIGYDSRPSGGGGGAPSSQSTVDLLFEDHHVGAVLPLQDTTIRMRGTVDPTTGDDAMRIGSLHYYFLRIPFPVRSGGPSSSSGGEAVGEAYWERLRTQRLRLRWWVLQPHNGSSALNVAMPSVYVWPRYEVAGRFVNDEGSGGHQPSPCQDVFAERATDTHGGTPWVTAVVAVNVTATGSSPAATDQEVKDWYLRMQPFFDDDASSGDDDGGGWQVHSCATAADFLSTRLTESTQLRVYTASPVATTEVVTTITNRTIVGALQSTGYVAKAALVGVCVGLVVCAILGARFMARHRGFRPMFARGDGDAEGGGSGAGSSRDTHRDEDADGGASIDDDDFELHNDAMQPTPPRHQLSAGGALPNAAAIKDPSTAVGPTELRDASTLGRADDDATDEADDDFFTSVVGSSRSLPNVGSSCAGPRVRYLE